MSQLPRYESYKDSGVQWLGEIPSHWKVTRLKFMAKIQNGSDYKHVQAEDGYPVIGSGGQFTYATEYLYKGESVLLGRKGTIDRPLYVNCAFWTVDTMYYTEIFNITFPKFLYYCALTVDFWKYSTQTALPSMTQTALSNLMFATPEYAEQKIIADFLDKRLAQVDALIAKQETLLEKLAEQRVALISHAVTKGLNPDVEMKESGISILGEIPSHWEIIKNKFIFDFSKGLTITKENLVDEGIPCVSYGEVHSKFGFEVDPNKHQLKCVPETYIESDENSLLKYGDFIFADTSEDVKGAGNFTYLNSDIPTFAGYHTIIAKMSKLNNPRFLAYILDTEEHRNQIRMLIKGVKVFSITQVILKNTFVWLPPIEEQNRIVDYLDQEVEKYQQIGQRYELTIKKLKEYRSTLITQVVTGKIDVRNLKVN